VILITNDYELLGGMQLLYNCLKAREYACEVFMFIATNADFVVMFANQLHSMNLIKYHLNHANCITGISSSFREVL